MPSQDRVIISAKDITHEKEQEQIISEYINVINSNVITSTTNLDGKIIDVSDAFCKISGYTKSELLGNNHSIIRSEENKYSLFENLWKTILENRVWRGEIKNRKKSGNYFWVDTTISPLYDRFNQKVGYTAIMQDITDKKRVEELSIKDELTTLYNRRHFNYIFPSLLTQAKSKDKFLSFLIIDIDYFKQYNDEYGHQMGDIALRKVALAIKLTIKGIENCYAFRLGGEEFGIILKSAKKSDSINIIQNLQNNIKSLKIIHQKSKVSNFITLSMGLISKNAQNINCHKKMYKEADDLLYIAKANGRNRVEID
jgi:diguanylate cyclase (GGDEF)-like protein/PAS domain S-box-containing protein